MATVKIKFVRHVQKLVRYVMEGREPNDPVSTFNCRENNVAEHFEALRQHHRGKGDVNAIHIIQSWSASESKELSSDEFNQIGRELVEAKFPGHAFAVVTHTDTGKVHNHIVVSPWHSETGKKIENKKRHLYELRSVSDSLCKGRGLSVIDGAAKDREKRLPEKVQKIEKFHGRSWILDLSQKADFARAYATTYDEYAGILGELGVRVRVEEKNITYNYGEQKRGKRGSKLGRLYDKRGLEQAFRDNDEKFARIPGLREQVRGIVGAVAVDDKKRETSKKALLALPETTYQQGHKDYSRFTKTDRPGRSQRFPHELDVANAIIPVDELRRARNSNIIKYCETNKIPLVRTGEGRLALKGRSFVEISDYQWVNKSNRTRGSLIELVAAHKNLTFLQAVAEINGNKRLLILDRQLGEVKRTFTSFYIPKDRQLKELDAKVHIARLMASYDADPSHAATLFKNGQAQVSREGVIRLFAKEDAGGAFEYVEHDGKGWRKSKAGTFNKAFFAVSTRSREASVYIDPFSFLKAHGKHALWDKKHRHDVICLMQPDEKVLDQYLAGNRHLQKVEIVFGEDRKGNVPELDFFNNLKARYKPLGIEVSLSQGHERSRERGMDLPSM